MESFNGSNTGSERPHAVLLASPLTGHLIPLAELARRLVEHHSFAVTLVTFSNLSLPAHVLSSCLLPPSVATAVLPSVDMGDIPAADIFQVFLELIRRSVPNLRALVRGISATAGPLAALVVDFFFPEALLVAAELGVPGYVFVPTNLTMLALERRFMELHHGLPPGEYRDFPEVVELAEGVSMRREDFPVPYRDPNRLAFPQLLEDTRRYLRADGFLVNTFDKMEPALVEAFRLAAEQRAFPPVFTPGPLVRRSKPEPDVGDQDCLEWLDRQPTGSVVYVSFGSGGSLSLEQTTELVAGLEDSGQRFLWVVRVPDLTAESETATGGNDDDPLAWLPEGFLERTAGRGLAVTAWAPQVRVLSHPATAAFLSHCGWNSALESVQSGVPMVALPLGAEQRMNAVILEREVGVALRPPAREDGVVVRDEIAAAVKELLMDGEKGRFVRRRAGDMQQEAARASLPEGSSRRALEEVATKWKLACGMEK
ncbi:UDP-glycosyltransferase 72B1-like [Lolium perenne]|uniref:UDP-glycosyltransferase 72B1-like n=1 Tax=Lolium perenne TaxID=4522 RepID=UPI0021EABC9F|nr:UDP-glycosyltransferase 72B1-like [Lolium perenne]